MDKCGTDAEFDSYWDNEAKNQNRNRIRVGRQYQASIPPLLKPGQKDGRKSEELETLKWKPDQISDQTIEEYLSMAKGLGLFSKSLDSPKPSEKSDNSLQSAIKGLSEFVTSHHPCHHDDGCKVPQPSSSGECSTRPSTGDWSPQEAQLFAQALEACGKNFGAIKKEYLPWKPIKSIIEYYYEGKGEKPEDLSEAPECGELSPKQEKSPSPSCSKDEKPLVKEESPPYETKPEPSLAEDPPKDSITFLDNARVTDHCKATPPDMKMSFSENNAIKGSPTVGSLKFFLGGRLVLKLNAQQDSGSGTNKCQWVQSNDLPKHPNSIKKERQRKKCIQEGSFTPNVEQPTPKKTTDPPNRPVGNNCDPSSVKKPRLKSEYDFLSENNKQGMLMCSSYWTPPVADGQEAIVEVDDGSSKTSEGYISPVLSNPRFPKADNYNDSSSASPVHLNSRFASRTDEGYASPVLGSTRNDRYLNPRTEYLNDKTSDGYVSPVLPNSRNSIPTEGYISPVLLNSRRTTDHSNSPDLESDSASRNSLVVRNSPNRCNDSSSPYKQEVLNHKSALSHSRKSLCYQPRASHSSGALLKQWNKWPTMAHSKRTSSPCSLSPISVMGDRKSPVKENPLDLSSRLDTDTHRATPKMDGNPAADEAEATSCWEFSPQSSNVDSPHKKCPEDQCCEGCHENSDCSPGKDDNSENSSQSNYATYCNLPYRCALPKCTKDYSSLEEVPLDLSSANESLKENTAESEKISETVDAAGTDNSAAAVEKGMLYQLLKSKVSK
ncbi:hypothetical protein JTE90_004408 [Oedothorax gibbosus]|uniref:Uncharacterized protein n=1 Tax=Oedothorax gibbosus TaxID=931172 RepID=A0AAV6URG0_9ARAC|nr:hypothetical protein JTE90_004408 [Oedothorax gibbosus]